MPTKRALLIASSVFDNDPGIMHLQFPDADVSGMESVLSADDFSFLVETIRNESNSTVVDKIETWMSAAHSDDLLMLYFSGHGLLNRSRELFLSCRNTKENRLNSTAVKYQTIVDLVREHAIARVAIILDCCYAGRALSRTKNTIRSAVQEGVQSQFGRGIFFLGASGANQTAEEREADGHGRLTRQIIDGLRSGDADVDGDGDISAKDLSTYVKRELRKQNAEQEPMEGGAFQGEIIFGANRKKKNSLLISSIRSRVDKNRRHFSKTTYRTVEDYLDELAQDNKNQKFVEDERFLALRKFASDGILEHVIKAFLESPKPNLGDALHDRSELRPPVSAGEQVGEATADPAPQVIPRAAVEEHVANISAAASAEVPDQTPPEEVGGTEVDATQQSPSYLSADGQDTPTDEVGQIGVPTPAGEEAQELPTGRATQLAAPTFIRDESATLPINAASQLAAEDRSTALSDNSDVPRPASREDQALSTPADISTDVSITGQPGSPTPLDQAPVVAASPTAESHGQREAVDSSQGPATATADAQSSPKPRVQRTQVDVPRIEPGSYRPYQRSDPVRMHWRIIAFGGILAAVGWVVGPVSERVLIVGAIGIAVLVIWLMEFLRDLGGRSHW
jgi:hypothetical protein